MSGTMMRTMCKILVVTQRHNYILKNVLKYYLRCFTDMALHSREAVTDSAAVSTDHAQTAAVWKAIPG